MTVAIAPVIQMTAVETFSVDAASDQLVEQNAFNLPVTRLNASSTPAVTKACYKTYALIAGALTIDLTALLDAFDVALTALGLKVQTVIIKNPTGNASITIVPGASDPYNLFGATSKIVLPAGATIAAYLPEGTPDVAAGAKTLDITGTGTQTFSIGFTFG